MWLKSGGMAAENSGINSILNYISTENSSLKCFTILVFLIKYAALLRIRDIFQKTLPTPNVLTIMYVYYIILNNLEYDKKRSKHWEIEALFGPFFWRGEKAHFPLRESAKHPLTVTSSHTRLTPSHISTSPLQPSSHRYNSRNRQNRSYVWVHRLISEHVRLCLFAEWERHDRKEGACTSIYVKEWLKKKS